LAGIIFSPHAGFLKQDAGKSASSAQEGSGSRYSAFENFCSDGSLTDTEISGMIKQM
jgi:hypothetical protein